MRQTVAVPQTPNGRPAGRQMMVVYRCQSKAAGLSPRSPSRSHFVSRIVVKSFPTCNSRRSNGRAVNWWCQILGHRRQFLESYTSGGASKNTPTPASNASGSHEDHAPRQRGHTPETNHRLRLASNHCTASGCFERLSDILHADNTRTNATGEQGASKRQWHSRYQTCYSGQQPIFKERPRK